MPNYVTVLLDLADGSGDAPVMGSALLAPSVSLADPGKMVLTRGQVQGSFGRDEEPVPSVLLLAPDSPGLPSPPFTYGATFPGVPGDQLGYSIQPLAGPCPFTAAAGNPGVFAWTPPEAFQQGGLVPLPDGTGISGVGITGFIPSATYWVTGSDEETFSLAAAEDGPALPVSGSGSGSFAVIRYRLSSLAPVTEVSPSAAFAQLGADLSGGPARVTGIQGTPVEPSPGIGYFLRDDGTWAFVATGIDGGSAGAAQGPVIDGGSASSVPAGTIDGGRA